MTSLAFHILQGDALRIEQFRFKHASCHPTTQFEDSVRMQDKNCDDKICPWILPWTIAILSASADQPRGSTIDYEVEISMCDRNLELII